MTHKSGFVNLIGMPNSGKSTLVNALMGQKMSIVSAKPQTTRQRIFSIWNEEDFQVIYSDLPGWIEQEKYSMHQLMNNMVKESGDDADILVIIDDPTQKVSFSESLIEKINAINLHKIFLINKIDKITPQQYAKALQNHQLLFGDVKVQGISALNSIGIEEIKNELLEYLPEHVAYYPKDYISDKPIRFFIAELIREQIYLAFSEEIPYSIFVEIDTCIGVDERAELARIESTIYVNRLSQVPIILGKNGAKIKDLGIKSRIEIEKYLGQRVYLGLSVKVKENWRDDKILIEKKGILR